MIGYEDFAFIIGLNGNVHIDEVRERSDDPLWIHTDLSRRLAVFPRQDWVAFVYDVDWGLLLIYKVASRTFQGVAYREIDAATATILLQYAATTHLQTQTTYRLLTSGPKQVAMTHMNGHRLFAHKDTHIPLPLPSAPPPDEE